MQKVFTYIKGDKGIWVIVALLALMSFLPVYSAASNLAYSERGASTFVSFLKHVIHLSFGFVIIYVVHKLPYRYFSGLSLVFMPVVLALLVATLLKGQVTESGTNMSRWLNIPFVNVSFQASTLASVVLLVFVARYLAKIKDKKIRFKESILPLWVPVLFVVGLILLANFSTAAILFTMVVTLAFIGGYPFKYLGTSIGFSLVLLLLFVLVVKAFPEALPNRVDTWISRIENFVDSEDTTEGYQIERAKIAIASGGIIGLGPGKSVQKNILPQSSSDFIYAIIIEEFGIIGGAFLMILYLWLLFRIVIVAQNADTVFGKLVVLGVGMPIVFQALLNMGVAVELFPVTGQTLPFISSGGTSIWMTCVAVGIILSVSVKREQIKQAQENEDNPLNILSETI